jgi:hypothetical protein
MPEKFHAFRDYIYYLPDTNVSHNYALPGDTPTFQMKFADGDCLQLQYYNTDCVQDILYKTRGALNFLDSLGWGSMNDPWPNAYTYFNTGYYEDPDDGWNFYYAPIITFGKCGNQGPQIFCTLAWCKDKEGNSGLYTPGFVVPKGQNPIVDPNNKDNLCPWLKEGGPKC